MTYTPQFSSPGTAALPGFGAPQGGGLASLYQQKLGRAPDQAGMDFYNGLMQNQGYTMQQVSDLIGGSQEATGTAAASGFPSQAEQPGFVFGRDDFSTAPMNTGVAAPTNTGAAASNFDNGLAGVYNQQLGRRPDQAGMDYYNNLMQNQGYTMQQVSDLIATSPEAQQFREFGPQSNIFDQSQNWMNDAASRFGNNFSAPNVSAGSVTADKFTDVNIDDYMNPFTQKVTDVTMDELERQRLMAMNNTDAAAAGAFGGSRHGVMQAETNRGFGDVAARTLAGLNSGAYSNAQGAAFQDIGNKLSADVGNQSASLQAQLANAQNAISANSQNLTGASGLAQLSNMGFSRGQSALDAQMQAGNMQQALQQQLINAARQQTNSDTGFTDEALSRLLAAMGGAQYGETTTESSDPGWLALLTAFA